MNAPPITIRELKHIHKYNKMQNYKTFIGVSMVQARPMTREEAFKAGHLKEKDKPVPFNELDEGYEIVYPTGYKSWCPAGDFERKNFPIADATKISKEDVESFIVKGIGTKLGDKTCLVMDSTITGFDTVATSPCVDPANYSQEIGEEIAREKIVDTIWGHLGFVLQWAKNGLNFKSK